MDNEKFGKFIQKLRKEKKHDSKTVRRKIEHYR